MKKLLFPTLMLMLLATDGFASFKIAAIPDTQRMTQYYPQVFKDQQQWIANNATADNIVFLTHLGDVVDDDVNQQYADANTAMNYIDGVIPYSICIGNHDYDTKAPSYVPPRDIGTTQFTNYFGEARFSGYSWYGGAGPHGLCHYQIFSADGRDWLHINIEYMADDEELLWAQRVLDAHPNLPAILSTHAFLNMDDVLAGTDSTQGLMANGGLNQWNKFVSHNDQIFMVLNGHYFDQSDDGVGNLTMVNDYGHDVFMMCINYQAQSDDDAHFRLLEFNLANNTINATTYQPDDSRWGSQEDWLTDSDNQFTLNIDFNARFNFSSREDVVTIQAGNITVVENNTTNGPGSVTLSLSGHTSDFSLGRTDWNSNGDYNLKMGSVDGDDELGGIMIACVTENGRTNYGDSAISYHIAQASHTSGGNYVINIAHAGTNTSNNGEGDVNASAAYFPFSGGWSGARLLSISNGSPTWAVVGSTDIVLGDNLTQLAQGTISGSDTNKAGGGSWPTTDGDRGVWDLTLPGVNSVNDGVLLACGGKNENNFGQTSAWDDGHGWQICSSGANGSGTTECDPINFVYVPYTTKNIVAGRISSENGKLNGTGGFTVSKTGAGTLRLDIDGYTPADGTLIVSTELRAYETDNFTTYEPEGDHWVVQTRDLPGSVLANSVGAQWTFVFIPFENTPFRPGPPANFDYQVTWGGGSGSWMDTNGWASSEAFDRWGIPGWLSGNPKNRGNSTLADWHEGLVYINSGTVDIPSSATLDGEIPHFQLGHNEGNSTMNIASDLTVRDKVYAGYASRVQDVATINQTAGNVSYGTSAASRTYWARGKGQVIYNLSGGTMATPGDWDQFGNNVSDSDDGASVFTFNQTGGTFTDSGASGLVMSDKALAISHVNISGGTFNANAAASTRIGHYGTTTMNISGASTVVSMTSKEVGIGFYASATAGIGTGIINMTNGTFTAANADAASVFSIGRSGNGTFTQMGGTVDLEGMNETFVGRYGGIGTSQGILNISDGTFKANRLHVGRNGVGTINQTGGTVTAAAYSTLGMYDGATGTINMDGGTLDFADDATVYYIGRSGVGTINQTGGTIIFHDETSIGRYNAASGMGTVNLSGGTFTVTKDALYVGYEGNGTFVQTGGELNTARLRLAQEDDANGVKSTGFYSISSGSLNVSAYITGGYLGTGRFEVIGSVATNISAANISFYDDTLRVILDGNGSTLLVADKSINTAYNGEVDMRGVFEIGTTNGFNGQPGDVYDIAWASDGVLTNGMVFSNLSSETFEWRVVDKNGGKMLQVYIPDTPVVNYDYWLRDYPALGNATNMADNPDGDAANNLAEYALGGDPSDAQSQGYLPESTLQEASGTNYVEYVYARRNDYIQRGLDYSLELNTNLVSGSWSNAGSMEVGSSALDAEFDAVTNHIPTDGKNQEFIHLRVDSQ